MDSNRQSYQGNYDRRSTYGNTNMVPQNQSSFAPPRTMVIENPYEQAQNALFERIVNNVAKLNDVIKEANRGLEEISMKNMNVELMVQMWQKYERNASFYLHETNQLQPLSSNLTTSSATTTDANNNIINNSNENSNSNTIGNNQSGQGNDSENDDHHSQSDSDLELGAETNDRNDKL